MRTDRFRQRGTIAETVDEITEILREGNVQLAGNALDFVPLECNDVRTRFIAILKDALDDLGVSVLRRLCHCYCIPGFKREDDGIPGQRKRTTSSRSCAFVAVAMRVRNRSMPTTS